MPQMQNRVQETTTTGGTGTLTLAGAVTGYITFASGFSTGTSLFYTIDNGVGEWEIGIGVLVTTGTLSRVTVIASSNGGALVNFGSGTKRVFCSAPTRSLVPDQDSKSGYVLTTDGANPAWTQTLNGITIGNLTAAAGAFTTLSASSTVSGAGFSTYLASPPAIGGTTPAAGNFTTLGATGNVTLGDAAGDTLTINGTAVSAPNGLNVNSNQLVLSGGNVGIGTSSPLERLHVAGGPALVTGTLSALRASAVSLDFAGGAGRIIATGADASTFAPIIFGNATTTTFAERMRIDSSGQCIWKPNGTTSAMTLDASGSLLVGDTSSGGARFKVRLDQNTLTFYDLVNVSNTASAGVMQRFITYNAAGTSTTSADIVKYKTGSWYFANNDGSIQMRAVSNGVELLSGATLWTTLSDETEKDIIDSINDSVTKLSSLRTVFGKYKSDSEGTRRPFLIAQDVQKVFPEVTPVLSSGKLGLDYSGMIPMLVKAIQELHAEIELLKAKVN